MKKAIIPFFISLLALQMSEAYSQTQTSKMVMYADTSQFSTIEDEKKRLIRLATFHFKTTG